MKPPKLAGPQSRTLREIAAAPGERLMCFSNGTVKAANQLVHRGMLAWCNCSSSPDGEFIIRGWRLTPYGRQVLALQDNAEAA